MELFNSKYTLNEKNFFEKIVSKYEKDDFKKINVIVVAHILPDAINFLDSLNRLFNVKKVFAKERSINQRVFDYLSANYEIEIANREKLSDKNFIDELIDFDDKFVLIDIGGYFSKISNYLYKKYPNQFLGSIEDTENGFAKYLKEGVNFPFIQVARSELKENEDFLVGQAVSFSAESIFRQNGILLNGLNIGIVGFGKIGSGISYALRNRQAIVSVNDINPIKITHAYSRGFIPKNKKAILKDSDIICLASGNRSLKCDDFKYVKDGSYLFTVTSNDDEIDFECLKKEYKEEEISEMVYKYSNKDNYFYLINKGNAINFVHGTTVSVFILLVQAGIMLSIISLLDKEYKSLDYSLSGEIQKEISDIWLKIFASNYEDVLN